MSTTKYLTDAERDELIQAYAEDKLNNPPANISDKTLIYNYGNEGQKGRLEIENFDIAVLTDPNFQSHKDEGANGSNPSATNTGDVENSGDGNDTNVETNADNQSGDDVNKDEQKPPVVEEKDKAKGKGAKDKKPNAAPDLSKADPKAAQHAADINEYLRLTGQRPFSGWDADQLHTELANLKLSNDEKTQAANKAAANAAVVVQSEIGDDEIQLKHKENGRTITVTQHAYDNFISKNQPEWVKVAPAPNGDSII